MCYVLFLWLLVTFIAPFITLSGLVCVVTQRYVKTTLTMCMNEQEDGFAIKVAKWEAFSFCFCVLNENEYEKKYNKII